MILADENIHAYIIKTLRDSGFEVATIQEQSAGIKDDIVIDIARKNNYILLTEDKDFGEWVFAHHVSDLSVLFLRYSFPEYTEIAGAIVRLLKAGTLERPFFATVTTKKIRVRKL